MAGMPLKATGLGRAAMHLVSQHQMHRVNLTIDLSFRSAENDCLRALRAHYAFIGVRANCAICLAS